VERFADYMVKDAKTGECFRADHLIEGKACMWRVYWCICHPYLFDFLILWKVVKITQF